MIMAYVAQFFWGWLLASLLLGFAMGWISVVQRGVGVTGARRHEIGPGDIVLIPRDTAHHIDPGTGKLGYLLMKIWAE